MEDHFKEIILCLKNKNIHLIRKSVSKIVGRDTHKLNKNQLISASLESLGENTSDGVIAPIFWGILFGLPGLVFYKIVNTLDSMIGYKNVKYKYFGYASAKTDDFLNYIPSRLTGLLFAVVSNNFFYSLKIMVKDGNKHASPNSGYPEAALSGALNIRISGPRFYNNIKRNDPWINRNGKVPSLKELEMGLLIFKRIIYLIINFSLLILIINWI